jgi:hypothetical protein
LRMPSAILPDTATVMSPSPGIRRRVGSAVSRSRAI